MDSNVSKNTFCYKLLNLALNPEDLAIKRLLKKRLGVAIELYRSNSDLKTEFAAIEDLIANKLILGNFNRNHPLDVIFTTAIAFPLANKWHLSPLLVAKNIKEFLPIANVNYTTKPILRFTVKVVSPGWLNFYMSDDALAVWLEQVIQWVIKNQKFTNVELKGCFSKIQYAHARCCSLLRLGHQEQLITIKHEYLGWEIVEPSTISWLDERGLFWLIQPKEKHLLIQLLIVVENLSTNSHSVNWVKLGQNLSDVFLDFWAECRIFGEINQKTPELAQARLGLVALVQYFLARILRDKLQVFPLTEL